MTCREAEKTSPVLGPSRSTAQEGDDGPSGGNGGNRETRHGVSFACSKEMENEWRHLPRRPRKFQTTNEAHIFIFDGAAIDPEKVAGLGTDVAVWNLQVMGAVENRLR